MSFPQYPSPTPPVLAKQDNLGTKPKDSILSAFSRIINDIKMNKVMKPATTASTQPAYQITTNAENLNRSTLSNHKDNMSTVVEYAPSLSESVKSKEKSQMSDEQLEKFYIEISFEDLAKLQPNEISDFMDRKESKEEQQNMSRRMPKSSKMSLKCTKEEVSESKRIQNVVQQIKKSSKKDNESLQTAVQIIPEEEEDRFNVRKIKKEAKKQTKKAEKTVQVKETKIVLEQVIPVIEIMLLDACEIQTKPLYESQMKPFTKKKNSKNQKYSNLRQQFIEIIVQCEEMVDKPPEKLKKRLIYESNEEENVQKYMVNPEKQVEQVNEVSGLPLNTGNSSLIKLVQELLKNRLINQALYDEFSLYDSLDVAKQYIQKFQTGKLHSFNFTKIKFTLLDHRRIAQLLLTLYPQNYIRGTIYSSNHIILNFLNRVYDLQASQYLNLLQQIDKISKIKWWKKIIIIQNDNLMSLHKEKKLIQKQTQQAMANVRALVQARNAGVIQTKEAPRRTIQDVYQIDCDENREHEIELAAKKMMDREKQKQRKQQKEQEDQAIARIRAIVSNFGNKSTPATDSPMGKKKVKFT